MAFTANMNTDVELFLRKSFPKALSAMHFSWDKMMKGERYHPATASAGQYRFVCASRGSLSADSHLVDQTAKLIAIWANA